MSVWKWISKRNSFHFCFNFADLQIGIWLSFACAIYAVSSIIEQLRLIRFPSTIDMKGNGQKTQNKNQKTFIFPKYIICLLCWARRTHINRTKVDNNDLFDVRVDWYEARTVRCLWAPSAAVAATPASKH